MTNYRELEWKQSPAHVRFLSKFKKPRSRKRESQYDYAAQELKEDVDQAIQRFVDVGMLIEPTLAQAISSIHNKPPIEEMLRKYDLKVSGSKSHIIKRLIHNVPEAAQSMVGQHDLLVCSPEASEFLEQYEAKRQHDENAAKTNAFSELLDGNGKAAYKIYTNYEKQYGHPDHAGSYHYYAEQMEVILKDEPELLNHLNDRDKKYLRAAVSMPMLWRTEPALKWLPDDFLTKFGDAEVVCNLLTKYGEIRNRIGKSDLDDKFEIIFDAYDVESCELCKKLDGQILHLNEIPELPYVECSSRKGCQCDVRHHWGSRYSDSEYDYNDEETGSSSSISLSIDYAKMLDFDSLDELIAEHIEKYIQEHVEIKLNPYSRLKQLKQMLDDDLITNEEYEQTKARILSSM